MRGKAIFLAGFVLAASTQLASAEKLHDGKGLIIVAIDRAGYEAAKIAAKTSGQYADSSSVARFLLPSPMHEPRLMVGPVDPGSGAARNTLSGTYELLPLPNKTGDPVIMIWEVPAGDYAIYSREIAGYTACFNAGTAAFHVASGELAYLGQYNPFQTDLDIVQAVDDKKLPPMTMVEGNTHLNDEHLTGLAASDDATTSGAADALRARRPGYFSAASGFTAADLTPIVLTRPDGKAFTC